MKTNFIGAITSFFVSLFAPKVYVPSIPKFDIEKYLGTWYEIARLNHSFERNLIAVTATYKKRQDGKIDVLNRGYNAVNNEWHEAHGYAVFTKEPNHLKVYFCPIFGGDYKVAYVDDNYNIAVVSGGSTAYLWFLSKTKDLSKEQLDKMIDVADHLGYDISKLIWLNKHH